MKNKIIGFIVGAIIFSGITAYAASVYYAKDISYTPSNDNFKVNNVESALNILYEESSKKISSLGETYTNKYYNGTKNETNEINLELEKGTYLCSVVYGNAGSWSALNSLNKSGQTMTISNCDAYNELYSYQNFQSGTNYFSGSILAEVLVGKSFLCNVNDKKVISASISSGEKNSGLPIGIEFACTKLNME